MMASSSLPSNSSTTVIGEHLQSDPSDQVTQTVVHLKLSKPQKNRKKVKWTEETVDNENMGKKKSKCCCVYVKPKAFDESDSDTSDGECDHCSGHVEKKPKNKSNANSSGDAKDSGTVAEDAS